MGVSRETVCVNKKTDIKKSVSRETRTLMLIGILKNA
jgi:hypothetical protein